MALNEPNEYLEVVVEMMDRARRHRDQLAAAEAPRPEQDEADPDYRRYAAEHLVWTERKRGATENEEAKAQALRDLDAAVQGDGDVEMEDTD
jgi:hypothetical protein